MSHASFVHLHVHSSYSLSEGAIKTDELAALCRAERMPAVAITDRNNLFGALEFSEACTKSGVQPILGCELALRRNSRDESRRQTRTEEPYWLALLVQNETGWRNLMALSSIAHLETPSGETPQIDLAKLSEHSQGLLALSGGPRGPLGALLLGGQDDAARAYSAQLAEMFPDRFYIELMRHGMEDETRIEAALVELAYARGLPLLATNDVYFGPRDKYLAHDALLCIAQSAHIDDEERARVTPDHCFRPPKIMRELFADLPEAVDNTLTSPGRCALCAAACADSTRFPHVGGQVGGRPNCATWRKPGLNHRLERSVFKPDMSDEEKVAAAKPYRDASISNSA